MLDTLTVYLGSDGEVTKAYYRELEKYGPAGIVAVNLFRAQKCSARAKVYRGGIRGKGSFKSMAYDRKNWSLNNLCHALMEHAASLGIGFGWKADPATKGYEWVLYVDLPSGQVSFHSPKRMPGPEYRGEWDGVGRSAERILEWCDALRGLPKGDYVIPKNRRRTRQSRLSVRGNPEVQRPALWGDDCLVPHPQRQTNPSE